MQKCYAAPSFKNGKYGTFWYCRNRSDDCHFICTEDQAHLYDKAVKAFLATNQDRPKCCAITSTAHVNGVTKPPVVIGRQYAEMKVVTDMEKESFGRPFFACPAKRKPCNYFEWGDQKIVETPLCNHQWASRMLKVKKEGPNKDRSFFCCREGGENRCKFFKWANDEEKEEDPLIPVNCKELDNKNEPVIAVKKRKTPILCE